MSTRSQAAAFSEAQAGLRRLGIPGILPALHEAGIGISRSVLGGSHSVAVYPPIDSLRPVDSRAVVETLRYGDDVSLYVHVAFCETRCTFCHYAVQQYNAHTDPVVQTRYLAALERELAVWGERLAATGTAVSSVYVGGGTPLILRQETLGALLETIGGAFDVRPDAEICVEGSPLTITAADGEEKLRFLRERGVTRLSFGVQSFDDVVLKYAARGYKRDVAIRAAQIASTVFDNWNIDLIQGLYEGSPFETWRNLSVIAELRPPHLTWYHGRFADRPQGDWYKDDAGRAHFENEEATLVGRMLIWQGLAELGYHQTDGNRFVRERHYADPFKPVRTSPSCNLLGAGAGSYSHVTGTAGDGSHGYVFRNDPNIGAYVQRVLAGDSPVATGRLIDDAELLAASYATGLRSGRLDGRLGALEATMPDLAAHYARLERGLRSLGVLEPYVDDAGARGVRLSALGRLFEDETLALFFSPAVQSALAPRGTRDDAPRQAEPAFAAAT